MHIDSYKIFSYGTTWKNGKESKVETVKHMLTSDECIRGKELIRLLEELEDTWHGDYGTMNLQNGTWVNIKKGKIKMENKLKRYVVMSKFNHSDSYMLEKQFVNRSSADKYAELMEEAKEYDNIEYFLFEQSHSYTDTGYDKDVDEYEDSIPF